MTDTTEPAQLAERFRPVFAKIAEGRSTARPAARFRTTR